MTQYKNHIDEQTLSRYVLNDSTLIDDERLIIERHLNSCMGCKALFEQIEEFYASSDTELEQNSTLGERHKKELMKQSNEPTVWTEPISSFVPRENVNVPARIWYFARKRPVVSTAGVFAVIAAIVFSVNIVTKSFADTNPSYYRIESKNLVVYNKHDEIVWKKPIDADRFSTENLNTSVTKSVTIVDSDGDGINDIITIFTFLDEQLPPKNAITAYNNKGEILWRKTLGSTVRYGEQAYSLDFRTEKMLFYDNGATKRILVLILHTHSPSAIVSLDEQGKIIGEYWNYGHCVDVTLADVDNDGQEELVTTILNDETNQTMIAAIDPLAIVGTKQSLFSNFNDIGRSDAMKYYSSIDQNTPFSSERNTFSRIVKIESNTLSVYYGPPVWQFSFNFGNKLQLEDILATDNAIEKYGIDGVKEEIIKLKQVVKHWEKGKPPV